MFALTSSMEYYLFSAATDMRMGFDALCGLVQTRMNVNARSGQVFIFVNRRRDRLKLLHWEPGGFVLYCKRLEMGTFEIPPFPQQASQNCVDWPSLVMIIEGFSVQNILRRKRFQEPSKKQNQT